ncbi:MAG: ATP-binding protein [Lachnospiraceae bacterium]|nr:ATP-binding protein [Lachnospiraceae bacterium]
MALTSAQYSTIMQRYEVTRLKNYHLLEERRKYVYENIEGYKELDESTVSVSMDVAKRKMAGDDDAMAELHTLLEDLKGMKKSLLLGAGLPEDYLEPIYDCPDCKDTGYIGGNKKCHCLKQQIIEVLYEQSNLRDYLNENNFSKLSYEYHSGEGLEAFKRAVTISKDFIKNFDFEKKNILFYGSVGTGKSFLSACIAKDILDLGHSVIYFSAISLFDALARETFENKSKEDLYNFYDYIYNCDLLIVDDLGTEVSNTFVSNQLFSFINERNLRKKSTIISTNLSLEQIRDRYSERVFSRIISTYTACKLSGTDIRIVKRNCK